MTNSQGIWWTAASLAGRGQPTLIRACGVGGWFATGTRVGSWLRAGPQRLGARGQGVGDDSR